MLIFPFKYDPFFQCDLEKMSDDEFLDNVEALATKRLEKPKTMKAQGNRYWAEIDSGFYLFERSNLFNSQFSMSTGRNLRIL